ncbi:MAG: phosphatidylserine decarboxylase, partial [Sterolibacterium sp.]|nr:phosphatidylserine decarboxylase [Sterolibacterium sp.]
MATYPHPLIAREGWPFIAGSLLVAVLVTWLAGGLWAVVPWLAFVFCLQFFRDPARPIPGDGHSVLSPADGRIVAIEPVRDPWLEREALKVSVFMNVFNVHSNRSPVDGEVRQRWY